MGRRDEGPETRDALDGKRAIFVNDSDGLSNKVSARLS